MLSVQVPSGLSEVSSRPRRPAGRCGMAFGSAAPDPGGDPRTPRSAATVVRSPPVAVSRGSVGVRGELVVV